MIRKVGLMGASGRVGGEIAALLAAGFRIGNDWLELADAVTGSGKLTSLEGVDCRKLSDPPREPVHVWIDFSRPEGTLALLETIDAPIVIGTTGFTAEQLVRVRAFGERKAVLIAPNTSPSLAVMAGLLSALPRAEEFPCDVIVAEEHHVHKKDAPSGTAKRLLEILADRGYDRPQIHITRAGEIVGVHTIQLVAGHESISIQHRVGDRRVFAEGALRAAAFMASKPAGLYSMQDVFFSERKEK